MPHPERAAEPILGSDDGLLLLRSVVESVAGQRRPVEVGTAAPPHADVAALPPAVPLHRALGVTDEELVAIRDRLGRDPERPRAGHVQRHVERALLLQELAAAAGHAAHRGPRRGRRAGRERRRGAHR